MADRKLALLDIDGLLADDRHRQHFAVAKEWDDYFAETAMAADTVWLEGRTLAEKLVAEGAWVGYLTGRREDTRPVTYRWLYDHSFPLWCAELMMKGYNDKRPTPIVKATKILELKEHWDSVVLYDDDPEVCRIVNAMCGEGTAVHCTWHIKPAEMVRRAET